MFNNKKYSKRLYVSMSKSTHFDNAYVEEIITDMVNENQITIVTEQHPGQVSFHNFDEVRKLLGEGLSQYKDVVYSSDRIDDAKKDRDKLKAIKKKLTEKEKEIEAAYSLPYVNVKKQLDELIEMVKEPLSIVDKFIKAQEVLAKRKEISEYAEKRAKRLGEYASKILESPAFANPKWDNATFKTKQWKDEIDCKIEQAVSDINIIQNSGNKYNAALLARYFETLSLEGSNEFLENIDSDYSAEQLEMQSENNIKGYKILKITATEDQMANLLKQMELMGLEVEELEDGMPRDMEELTEPTFDSFVAFDIETTGTYGAANGDAEAGITEIGAVRVENGQIVEKFDELANPGREIVPRIARLTHITNEMIADKPPIDEIMRKFKDFCGNNVLVGHNIKSSDLHYISKAAKKAGIVLENQFLDTYILAKQFKNGQQWEKLNLVYLAKQYGFEHKEAHRAWSDAEVNASVYFELKKLCEQY